MMRLKIKILNLSKFTRVMGDWRKYSMITIIKSHSIFIYCKFIGEINIIYSVDMNVNMESEMLFNDRF